MNLSVIIPVHNGTSFISRAIESIVAVSKEIEIVLVENGSSDNSWELILESYASLNISKLDQASKSTARNTGAKIAKSELITFLDQDDEFRPERYTVEYMAFAQSGGVVIGTQIFLEDEKSFMPKYILEGISRNLPNYVPISMLISKSTFFRFNGFDVEYNLAEDFEFLTRLHRGKIPVRYVNDAFLTRHFHSLNDSHQVLDAQRELFKLLRNHTKFQRRKR